MDIKIRQQGPFEDETLPLLADSLNIVFGDNGVGKTSLFSGMHRVLLMDRSNGHESGTTLTLTLTQGNRVLFDSAQRDTNHSINFSYNANVLYMPHSSDIIRAASFISGTGSLLRSASEDILHTLDQYACGRHVFLDMTLSGLAPNSLKIAIDILKQAKSVTVIVLENDTSSLRGLSKISDRCRLIRLTEDNNGTSITYSDVLTPHRTEP